MWSERVILDHATWMSNAQRYMDIIFMLLLMSDEYISTYGCNRLGSRGNKEALLMLFNFKNNMMTRSKPGHQLDL